MNVFAEHMLCLIASVISLVNLYIYLKNMNLARQNNKLCLLIGVNCVYISLSYSSFITARPAEVNFIVQLFSMFIILIPYRLSFVKKTTLSLLLMTFMVILELVIELTFVSLNKVEGEHGYLDKANYLLGMLTSQLLAFMFLSLIRIHKQNVGNKEEKTVSALFLVLPASSIFIIYCIHEIIQRCIEVIEQDTYMLAIRSMSALALINVYCYALLRKIYSVERTKQENQILKEQMKYYSDRQKLLDSNYQSLRTMKHDLKHHFLYFYQKIKNISFCDLGKLESEMWDLIQGLEPPVQISYCDNFELNGILNYKLYEVSEKSIPLDIRVVVRKDTKIDVQLLCVVLGNLIDNAIENFNDATAPQQNLLLRIYEENENLYLKISNPYKNRIKFHQQMPITQKPDKTNHGIGLRNVKKLVEENNGMMRLNIAEFNFTVEIILYDGAESA